MVLGLFIQWHTPKSVWLIFYLKKNLFGFKILSKTKTLKRVLNSFVRQNSSLDSSCHQDICLVVSFDSHDYSVFSYRNRYRIIFQSPLQGHITYTGTIFSLRLFSDTPGVVVFTPSSFFPLSSPPSSIPPPPRKVNTASSSSRSVTWGHRLSHFVAAALQRAHPSRTLTAPSA